MNSELKKKNLRVAPVLSDGSIGGGGIVHVDVRNEQLGTLWLDSDRWLFLYDAGTPGHKRGVDFGGQLFQLLSLLQTFRCACEIFNWI